MADNEERLSRYLSHNQPTRAIPASPSTDLVECASVQAERVPEIDQRVMQHLTTD